MNCWRCHWKGHPDAQFISGALFRAVYISLCLRRWCAYCSHGITVKCNVDDRLYHANAINRSAQQTECRKVKLYNVQAKHLLLARVKRLCDWRKQRRLRRTNDYPVEKWAKHLSLIRNFSHLMKMVVVVRILRLDGVNCDESAAFVDKCDSQKMNHFPMEIVERRKFCRKLLIFDEVVVCGTKFVHFSNGNCLCNKRWQFFYDKYGKWDGNNCSLFYIAHL